MNALKQIGSFFWGLLILVAIFALVSLVIHGAGWVSDKAMPIVNLVTTYSMFALILIAFPLSFFKSCRGWCGLSFLYWSYLCGLALWMLSLLVTLQTWGTVAVIIGLLLAGIGVFPIAVIASIVKGEWLMMTILLGQFGMVVVARIYGIYLIKKAENEVIDV